jgi:putative transcriptional regulator
LIVFLVDIIITYKQYNNVIDNTQSKSSSGESGIYNRIAVLRTERGVSRQQLAEALGVNYQTIGFLERGDYGPSLKLTLDLSEFFCLPVEAIFSKTPFRPLSEQVYGSNTPRQVEPASNHDKETK